MKEASEAFPEAELAVGKLPPPLLQQLLALPRRSSPDVVVGPSLGEDAAVVRLGRRLVAVTSDPITFPTPRPGFFAIHVNANDIAVMGARPCYYTIALILPPGTPVREAGRIMCDALEASEALGIVLLGGHTEVSPAVTVPVACVTMIGELLRPEPACTANGRAGDAIIQVNPLGVEGTAILAAEYREQLLAELGEALVDRAADFCCEPGLSVVAPAVLASTRLRVHAMHDPTEGGIATGLREIAAASGTGLIVKRPALVQRAETEQVCRVVEHDPLGIISSGCLLFTTDKRYAAPSVKMLAEAGFAAAEIGVLTASEGQCLIEEETGRTHPLPTFAVDEIVRE